MYGNCLPFLWLGPTPLFHNLLLNAHAHSASAQTQRNDGLCETPSGGSILSCQQLLPQGSCFPWNAAGVIAALGLQDLPVACSNKGGGTPYRQ
jgi:hypothetical protein